MGSSILAFATNIKRIMLLPNERLWCSGNGMDLKCKGYGIDSRVRYQRKMDHVIVE